MSPEFAVIGAIVAKRAGATQTELDFLIDRLVTGRTMEDIALDYGCTRSNVGQQLQSVRCKLKRRHPVAA